MTTSNHDLDALTIREFARRSSQSESTVRRRIQDGSLKAWQPDGTDTYCWTPEEVAAILQHCQTPELDWLRQVVIGLAATGLRISELASLRWSDITPEKTLVTLTDATTKKSRRGLERRTTKSGRDRTFPIQKMLGDVRCTMSPHPDGRVFHSPLGG
jgi:hypothetical protein